MAIREKLAALLAASGALGRPAQAEPVVQLTDAEAVALAGELAGEAVRFPDLLPVRLAAVLEAGDPPADADLVIPWAQRKAAALAAFWDVFEGEVVDGCRIIRRRA